MSSILESATEFTSVEVKLEKIELSLRESGKASDGMRTNDLIESVHEYQSVYNKESVAEDFKLTISKTASEKESDIHSSTHKKRRYQLESDHLRKLRAIWENVPEQGRMCLPSLASRKDWSKAHGLKNHEAVSAWFGRAKSRARKKIENVEEDEVVEIGRDEAMMEWRLVREDSGSEEGTWVMKRVPMEVLSTTKNNMKPKPVKPKKSTKVKIEEISPTTLLDSMPSNNEFSHKIPHISLDPQSTFPCVTESSQSLDMRSRMCYTPSPSDSWSFSCSIPPVTPSFSPTGSLSSITPSSLYDLPITPESSFNRSCTAAINECTRSQCVMGNSGYKKIQNEYAPNLHGNWHFMSDELELMSQRIPATQILSTWRTSQVSNDCSSWANPALCDNNRYMNVNTSSASLRPSALGRTEFISDTNCGAIPIYPPLTNVAVYKTDETREMKAEENYRNSRCNCDTFHGFRPYPIRSYVSSSTGSMYEKVAEDTICDIQTNSRSNALNRSCHIWKNPRYVLQKPRTNVVLSQGAYPELSAIPYLDGVERYTKETTFPNAICQQTYDFENIPADSDSYSCLPYDFKIIDNISMLPESALNKLLCQWEHDALDALSSLDKDLDLSDKLSSVTVSDTFLDNRNSLEPCLKKSNTVEGDGMPEGAELKFVS